MDRQTDRWLGCLAQPQYLSSVYFFFTYLTHNHPSTLPEPLFPRLRNTESSKLRRQQQLVGYIDRNFNHHMSMNYYSLTGNRKHGQTSSFFPLMNTLLNLVFRDFVQCSMRYDSKSNFLEMKFGRIPTAAQV